MSKKQNMLTAKYDMKVLKKIVDIDDKMKQKLCDLAGIDDEDDLPDPVQNLDLQDYLGFSESEATSKLMKVFSHLNAKDRDLEILAQDVSKRIQGLVMPEQPHH
uniref:NET domain-containing protein n=1 Tax=Aureoumbra lagunensis TaxID=44058 RepID=A0A7S3NJA3_9STRA|mmetsp:Transcript_8775/g.12204  ORF Transcript_8775/g.12204 Transcript_8775/m.12204 type:complete len:104 (+) Transcript_8775:103-414(+)